MALITSPPSNPKLHNFSPLPRRTQRPGCAVFFIPRVISNISASKTFLLTSKFSIRLRHYADRRAPAIVATAALVEEAEPEPEPTAANCRRILLSDVVVNRQRSVFWGRRWNSRDIATAGVVLAMHCVCLFAPFQFNWGAVSVAMALYVVTGLFGITLSFHRNLSHRSFKLPKWLEYTFAYCGALALQVSSIS